MPTTSQLTTAALVVAFLVAYQMIAPRVGLPTI